MFNKVAQSNKHKQQIPVFQEKQLAKLKEELSDITLTRNGENSSQHSKESQNSQKMTEGISHFRNVKKWANFILELNSRAFDKYTRFSGYLNMLQQIQNRPQLKNIHMTVSMMEILTVIVSVFLPRKFLSKIITLVQVVEKYMMNYYIEQIALTNNKMLDIEQEARNLIEFKYRIHEDEDNRRHDPQIKHLLLQIDKKNLEYFTFKKVQLLL